MILQKLLNDDIETSPTITPVLDLTNISAGLGTLNGMFGNGNYGIGINGPVNLPQPNGGNVELNQIDYTSDIANTRAEIAEMRKDIQNLSTAMTHLRLVMNTGAVVGAIGPEMDLYLGRQGFYAARTELV